MDGIAIILAAWAFLGHFSLCIAVINRLHSTALPRWMLKVCDGFWYAWLLGVPWVLATGYLHGSEPHFGASALGFWHVLAATYLAVCVLAATVALVHRICRAVGNRTTRRLASNHTRLVSLQRNRQRFVSGRLARMAMRLPGNEILSLSVHEKTLVLPRLNRALQGLTIAHISDLHLTGQLSQAFYEEVVKMVNELDADLVAVTGDIVERRCCLPWVGETLAKFKSRLGAYYVLGNHELRIRDEQLVRRTLDRAGLVGLGARWQFAPHTQWPIVLAGTELPWYPPAADMQSCPETIDGKRPLRICLSHSPDQLRWARAHHFDLMLAGHTHGGQVQFPLVGPILSPSAFGTRHAAGTFFCPPTLLHVSRGIAGTRPLRWNCPPEIARLTLQSDG